MVIIIENGLRHFRLMRWGLLPSWVKDPRKFTLLINARAETMQEKPAFKNAIKPAAAASFRRTAIMSGTPPGNRKLTLFYPPP